MTLQELKDAIDEAVMEYGPEILKTAVCAAYNYGDICQTQAVTDLESLEFMVLKESAYSNSGLAVPDDWENQDWDDAEREPVFVLI